MDSRLQWAWKKRVRRSMLAWAHACSKKLNRLQKKTDLKNWPSSLQWERVITIWTVVLNAANAIWLKISLRRRNLAGNFIRPISSSAPIFQLHFPPKIDPDLMLHTPSQNMGALHQR